MVPQNIYRGRLAPSPTGYLHLGHAMTFWRAQQRARSVQGKVILRIEDIDRARCRPEFVGALEEDLRWFGLTWEEGPYSQTDRIDLYRSALARLRAAGFAYPCHCSRRDVLNAARAPHREDEEPVYPGTCRNREFSDEIVSWRFRIPDGEDLSFHDQRLGEQRAVAGRDFGDFVLWRRDNVPSYQLAVVVDDAAMQITEVVRGEDLLLSTFRQLLLYRALGLGAPKFFHTQLILDECGTRLAKRHAALTLRALRESGAQPGELRLLSGHGRAHGEGGD